MISSPEKFPGPGKISENLFDPIIKTKNRSGFFYSKKKFTKFSDTKKKSRKKSAGKM